MLLWLLMLLFLMRVPFSVIDFEMMLMKLILFVLMMMMLLLLPMVLFV